METKKLLKVDEHLKENNELFASGSSDTAEFNASGQESNCVCPTYMFCVPEGND